MTNPSWLEAAARRSGQEAWTLGRVFEQYRKIEECTSEALAAKLGCSLEVLGWLSLCRRPQGENFKSHVLAISKRFAVDSTRLVAVLRRVEVLEALATRAEKGSTEEDVLLIAARDRSGEDETGP